MKKIRCWLADRLCRLASWLRGERWYVSDVFWGVPGNRIAELRETIWQQAILLAPFPLDEQYDHLHPIDAALNELAQAAGQAWGHYPPDWWEKEQERWRLAHPETEL